VVKNVENKPKLKGLSFNLFAIIGVLVILPLATGFVSGLANSYDEEYISISKEYQNEIKSDPEGCIDYYNNGDFYSWAMSEWVDKGINQTHAYEIVEQTNDPFIYRGIWQDDYRNYKFMSVNCNNPMIYRDDYVLIRSADDHRAVKLQGSNGNIPNYHGYIGYSGDDFTINITSNFYKYLEDGQDIAKIKIIFMDYEIAYNCDDSIFEDISFKADILMRNNFHTKSYNNFEFEQDNSIFINSYPTISGSFCHVGIEVEYDFSPFESIEIGELFSNDYQNLSTEIRLYDFDIENRSYSGQTVGQPRAALPFNGDSYHGLDVQIGYVDTSRVNFWLSGGTLIMGIALFLLAIANTTYWNPVVEFFKPKGGI